MKNNENNNQENNNYSDDFFLNELENARKTAVRFEIIGLVIGIIIGVIIFFLLSGNGRFVAIVPVFLCPSISIPKKRKFERLFKSEIVLSCFERVFQNVKYTPNYGIDREVLRETGMVDTGDRFTSNDLVEASYKNINFISSDVHIEEEETDGDGNTNYYTTFKGQWYIFDFNKKFKSDLQVVEKYFSVAKRGSLFDKKSHFKKVELEDIEFNKQFKVFARDEMEAFYILTPQTMNKIKEINQKIPGKFLFCFIDNKLHIGLDSGKDLYVPNLYRKINLEECNTQVMSELSAIIDFIEMLSLDNTLFKNSVL